MKEKQCIYDGGSNLTFEPMVSETTATAAAAVAAVPIGYLVYAAAGAVVTTDSVAFGVAFLVMLGMATVLPRLLADRV